jgi:UPF0288 family protein (methanogenesis marker protein 3)
MKSDEISTSKIYEIRIEKVSELSKEAQSEVARKLEAKIIDTDRYLGYAKVIYERNSPLSVKSVDPIEGTIITYFRNLPKQ